MRKLLHFIAVGCLLAVSLMSFAAPASPKNWTFLIYLNGNNNLDYFGAENLRAMEKVGSNDQVNVVVQWASLARQSTVRLLVQKSTNPKQVTSPILEDIGNVDMGSKATLNDFVAWGVKNFPAEHYFIAVWDHGSGWHFAPEKQRALLSGKKALPYPSDISWDENTGNFISTEQLGESMAYAASIIGHKVDVYGSDACLMGMAEVANQMSDNVAYFIGSQETEPGAGWPYDDLLAKWEATANATPADVSNILVDTYVAWYENHGRQQVTMSAYDLTKVAALDDAVAKLGAEIRTLNAINRTKVINMLPKVQRFAYDDYADLLDFTKRLGNMKLKGIQSQTLIDVTTTAKDLVLANKDTSSFWRANGVSIWLPTDSGTYQTNAERYHNLVFTQMTAWDNTIAFLLNS